jgi:hypothetical protein
MEQPLADRSQGLFSEMTGFGPSLCSGFRLRAPVYEMGRPQNGSNSIPSLATTIAWSSCSLIARKGFLLK